MEQPQIVRPQIAGPTAITRSGSPFATLDEERREILESVMGALSSADPDPDEMAACSYLLKHLSATAGSLAA